MLFRSGPCGKVTFLPKGLRFRILAKSQNHRSKGPRALGKCRMSRQFGQKSRVFRSETKTQRSKSKGLGLQRPRSKLSAVDLGWECLDSLVRGPGAPGAFEILEVSALPSAKALGDLGKTQRGRSLMFENMTQRSESGGTGSPKD